MPEPTLPVAPVRADDPIKKKKGEEKDGKPDETESGSASKANGQKEDEGEELVCPASII